MRGAFVTGFRPGRFRGVRILCFLATVPSYLSMAASGMGTSVRCSGCRRHARSSGKPRSMRTGHATSRARPCGPSAGACWCVGMRTPRSRTVAEKHRPGAVCGISGRPQAGVSRRRRGVVSIRGVPCRVKALGSFSTPDGGHVSVGRHTDPSEEELEAVASKLRSAGTGGWLAVMEGAYYGRGVVTLLNVREIVQAALSWDDAVAAFQRRRLNMKAETGVGKSLPMPGC